LFEDHVLYIYTRSQCNLSNFKISKKNLVCYSIRTKSGWSGQCPVTPDNVRPGASLGVFKLPNHCLLFKLLSLSISLVASVSLLPNFVYPPLPPPAVEDPWAWYHNANGDDDDDDELEEESEWRLCFLFLLSFWCLMPKEEKKIYLFSYFHISRIVIWD
jgi:hypothetical protein